VFSHLTLRDLSESHRTNFVMNPVRGSYVSPACRCSTLMFEKANASSPMRRGSTAPVWTRLSAKRQRQRPKSDAIYFQMVGARGQHRSEERAWTAGAHCNCIS